MNAYNDRDTIYAPITPEGRGAVSVIRLSGDRSFEILKSISSISSELESHKAYFCNLQNSAGKLLDEVLVTSFVSGKSFTGEESVEISCHGNPLIVQSILDELLIKGARMAEPGEFSYRAFRNGKLDLAQAESINSLIHAENEKFVELSLKTLKGQYSGKVEDFKAEILWLLSRMESAIEFPEQDIANEEHASLVTKAENLSKGFKGILDSTGMRHDLKTGFKVLLMGPPNVGKSSLFNNLLGSERALVSNIQGTTRDFISDTITIKNGFAYELIDTAGVRSDSEDELENKGIKRTLNLVKESQFLFLVIDSDTPEAFIEEFICNSSDNQKVFLILTKIDIEKRDLSKYTSTFSDIFYISNFDLESIKSLYSEIEKRVLNEFDKIETQISPRQILVLQEALAHSNSALEALRSEDLTFDIVCYQYYRALDSLNSALYIENEEEVRDKVFKDFCIGK